MAGSSSDAATASITFIVAMVVGTLVTGTLNTLTMKIQYTIHSTDIDGQDVVFKKPWFGSLNMLFAMAFVGLVDFVVRQFGRARRIRAHAEQKASTAARPNSSTGAPAASELSYFTKVSYVMFPAVFDLVATGMACYGILYIPASVWQMLRGSLVLFVALLSIPVLGKKMTSSNWLGLFFCLLGICLVGASNCLSCISETSGHSLSDIIFGISMTLVAQIVQAGQLVGEEWLMKSADLRPLEVVGWEGLWGSLVLLIFVFPVLYFVPGADHGSQENLYDSFVMIGNNTSLLACVLVYLFSCATFNATGICVSQVLSSVHRMMLDASRTTVIWVFGLCATAIAPGCAFGEHWTEWSPLQLVGFVFVLLGQSTYGGLLKWPCLRDGKPADNRSIREHLTEMEGPNGGTSLVVAGQERSA